ncbi:hypothetical protein HYALB_00009971 [Hymenoscyphus albidus]|uniref:Uncharacterized protein n=1 Tax=Hymenoscyphus albidus TaxID=595503 RepID=A0A9N9LTK6_9HELO|nr:hypothetical protein HYALB_00009971 [Hymenoscyphus albidus]
MEEATYQGKEEKKAKNRFMGKLFKEKEKKERDVGVSVDDFLGPAANAFSAGQQHSNQPQLGRIDTSNASRWPTAAEITNIRQPRRRSASPKRSRKGLMVRFANEKPEIIGEGGDEAMAPVTEIGARRRSNTHPTTGQPVSHTQHNQYNQPMQQSQPSQLPPDFRGHSSNAGVENPANLDTGDFFQPKSLSRSLTGYQSRPVDNDSVESFGSGYPEAPAGNEIGNGSMNQAPTNPDDYEPTSFAARVRAEMRSGEGRALMQNKDEGSQAEDPELSPQMKQLRINTMRNSIISPSTTDIPDSLHPGANQVYKPYQGGSSVMESPAQMSRSSTAQGSFTESPVPRSSLLSNSAQQSYAGSSASLSRSNTTLQGAALAVADEAVQEFSSRVKHMFTLFRLSTESVKPLTNCTMEELTRISLWWFLKGRMNLENTVRDRPSSQEGQKRRLFALQQAHADLAKSLWINETVAGQRREILDPHGAEKDPNLASVVEVRQSILSSLRKLAMSMKRNGFMPADPNETQLAQGIDNSIWAPHEGSQYLVSSQRPNLTLGLSDSFPLGDTNRDFHFGRMFVDAVLSEDAEHYRCPVLVSLVRGHKEKEISAIIASQDGGLKLCISSDSSRGPTWNDVSWQQKSDSIRVALPRGFTLRLNCSEQDYRMILGLYEYQVKVHSALVQRRDELIIFEVILRSFQYIDSNPESRFPKESLPQCHFRLFEKSETLPGASGAVTFHRGYRIALNTHPKTKNSRSIDENLPPTLPIQFGFLRGEDGAPAMLLKIVTPKSNYKAILTFEDPSERGRLHELITGTALGRSEQVVAEAPLRAFSLSAYSRDTKDLNCFKTLDWKGYRVINEDEGDLESNKAVLSTHLRVALDFQTGSLTDRVNVGTGELKIRLDVKSSKELKIFREPQQDITLSVVESQVSHELPHELAQLLDSVAKAQSVRTYLFPSISDLHLFQAALTGFVVLYDGMATSFNIARRRMVVPIYKKWDANATRLQVVRREKVIQLLAFFEGFSHGDCMSFPLKSTDIFETGGKSGKWALKIVDAKFAMPKPKKQEGVSDHEFLCLDVPEFPGEHDDITIIFETESERDRFTQTLPAQAKLASRLGSVRR